MNSAMTPTNDSTAAITQCMCVNGMSPIFLFGFEEKSVDNWNAMKTNPGAKLPIDKTLAQVLQNNALKLNTQPYAIPPNKPISKLSRMTQV